MSRVFFRGLGELRGIAALVVVFHHIELFKFSSHVSSLFDTRLRGFVEHLGKNGVYLFFVLSGFLITYLLLVEVQKTGTINAAKFYTRRILRIWPVFYLIVVVSFFLLPFVVSHIPVMANSFFGERVAGLEFFFWQRLVLYVFFVPNLALIVYPPVAGAAQSWSVGVEEQFYLLWPQLIKWFKKKVLLLLIGVILGKFSLYYLLRYLNGRLDNDVLDVAISFLKSFNIELMAIGGIGAYLLFHGKLTRWYTLVSSKSRFVLCMIIFVALFLPIPIFGMGVLFLGLILMNIQDESSVLRGNVLSFFGDISYGIYMYHPVVMFAVFSFADYVSGPQNLLYYNAIVYAGVPGFTILISYLSFRYFESAFLRWKERFVVFPSGKPLHG